MFDKYEDVILIVLILIVIFLLILVASLKKDINDLKNRDQLTHKRINALELASSRTFRVIESNASSITFFRRQMNQVHVWLGEVLGVSNLIRNEQGEKDPTLIIDELRELVKWAKIKGKQIVNEDDYYKGD